MKTTLAVSCLALALAIQSSAHAVSIPLEAADNATVQPAGPRTGANGKAFLNLEGSANAAFASFGVADFNFASLTLPGPLVGVSLQMTQSNAAFSMTGPLSIYLTNQTAVDIQPANTMLNYVAGMDGAGSVDSDLSPLTLVGSGTYTSAGVGMTPTDTFALSFTGPALTTLQNALTNHTTLRLVVTPNTANTAATYAGVTNATLAGPTLVFEAVPEPATGVLAGLGMSAILAAARLRCGKRTRTSGVSRIG